MRREGVGRGGAGQKNSLLLKTSYIESAYNSLNLGQMIVNSH